MRSSRIVRITIEDDALRLDIGVSANIRSDLHRKQESAAPPAVRDLSYVESGIEQLGRRPQQTVRDRRHHVGSIAQGMFVGSSHQLPEVHRQVSVDIGR